MTVASPLSSSRVHSGACSFCQIVVQVYKRTPNRGVHLQPIARASICIRRALCDSCFPLISLLKPGKTSPQENVTQRDPCSERPGVEQMPFIRSPHVTSGCLTLLPAGVQPKLKGRAASCACSLADTQREQLPRSIYALPLFCSSLLLQAIPFLVVHHSSFLHSPHKQVQPTS